MPKCLRRLTIKNAAKIFILFFVLLFLAAGPGDAQAPAAAQPSETLRYAIKKLRMKVGEATLSIAEDKLGATPVYLIVFSAKAPKFFDEERIYVDRQTYYPLLVKRDLNIFGKKEKITEIYDTAKSQIRIVKEAKGKTTEQVIERKGAVDNIYSFMYRFRQASHVRQGNAYTMNLPTKTIPIKVIGKDQIESMGTDVPAVYLESDSRKYKLWFDMTPQRVPLRIDGAMGMASTSLVLIEHQP